MYNLSLLFHLPIISGSIVFKSFYCSFDDSVSSSLDVNSILTLICFVWMLDDVFHLVSLPYLRTCATIEISLESSTKPLGIRGAFKLREG